MSKTVNEFNINRRSFVSGAAGLGLASFLAGCSSSSDSDSGSASGSASTEEAAEEEEEEVEEEPTEVRVASLKGPTSIGLVSFMDLTENEPDNYNNTYTFTVSSAADEILPSVISGDLDIALIPANSAAVLYNNTEAGVTCIDINTLGVLNVVTGNSDIVEFTDLADHTVYLTGKGATPEYSMNYLLEQAGIADSVTLEFKSEATEVVSVLTSDTTAVGVLPQPYVTVALNSSDALEAPIDLTDVWDEYAGDTGSQLLTGVTVVRDEFLEEHPGAVEEFLEGQATSVETVLDDPDSAAALVVELGIIDSETVAAQAIPECHLVCITGDEMKEALSGYLQVIYDSDSSAVGGEMPGDDFYYGAE